MMIMYNEDQKTELKVELTKDIKKSLHLPIQMMVLFILVLMMMERL